MIEVDKLWKRYGLPLKPTLKRGWSRLRGLPYDETAEGRWSLKDVSFRLNRGESLGLIGHNGAGKSTLLKVLAGVSPATRGTVAVHGSMFPMIELNAGLHTELTGRENVYLLGAVMGFPRHEISARMGEIEAFCELGDWFDRPAWQYSSGMLARLGFGVAMNVEADLLLIDEVLAVGDLAFQRKCYARLGELRESGATIILVSHNIRQVERLCDRAIMLDHGAVIADDSAAAVAEIYYAQADKQGMGQGRYDSSGDLNLLSLEIQSLEGVPIESVQSGEGVRLVLELEAARRIEGLRVGINFVSTDMIVVASFSNDTLLDIPPFEGRLTLSCSLPSLPLNPAAYSLRLKVIEANGATLLSADHLRTVQVIRRAEEVGRLLPYMGFVRLDVAWAMEP